MIDWIANLKQATRALPACNVAVTIDAAGCAVTNLHDGKRTTVMLPNDLVPLTVLCTHGERTMVFADCYAWPEPVRKFLDGLKVGEWHGYDLWKHFNEHAP